MIQTVLRPSTRFFSWGACLLGILGAAISLGCSKQLDPPASKAPTITQATFEPVYRASKAILGATAPGVTYQRFGELLQAFSTELEIAKDHQMNDLDHSLMKLYQESFAAYQFSAMIWHWKIENTTHDWMKGEVPAAAEMADRISRFGIKVTDRVFYGRHLEMFDPDSAIQLVWQKARDVLVQATNMYYGRPNETDKAKAAPGR
jgi:hypothetical protein